jgi:hypothetical protein
MKDFPSSLVDAIVNYLGDRTEILGSQLGHLIRKTTPSWSPKKEYGSLRHFVDSELTGVLVHVGKQGGDDIYGKRVHGVDSGVPLSGDTRMLWNVFNNPQRNGRIIFKDATLRLLDNERQVPLDSREVPRIASDEYLELLKELAAQVPSDLREAFNVVLLSNNGQPWSEVINLFRKSGNISLFRAFEEARVDYVTLQFKKRLAEIGLSQEDIGRFEENLSASRGRRSASKLSANEKVIINQVTTSVERDDESLRKICHRAIDLLTIQQLRSLNFPLEVLIGAMREA